MMKSTRVPAGWMWSGRRLAYCLAALVCWAGLAGTAVAQMVKPDKVWITGIAALNAKQGSLVLHWTPTVDVATGKINTRYTLSAGKGCAYTPLPGDTITPGSSGTLRITSTNYVVNVVCAYGYKRFSVQSGPTATARASAPAVTEKVYVPRLQ